MRCIAAMLVAGLMVVPPAAHAGRSCEHRTLTADRLERGLRFAEQVRSALDGSGDQVVVLARVGQDLSRYGLVYSHLGFAYREADGRGGYRWRVLHKLNHCGSGASAIFKQGLGEFFLDDPWRYQTAWVRLKPDTQTRLLGLLADRVRAVALNEPRYSLVAYPWSTRYQQSNQWLIETLAMSLDGGIASRQDAQRWLQASGYEPSVLHIGPLERLGARISAANVAFDDHPNSKRFADHIETVSGDSVFAWLGRTGLSGVPQSLTAR